MIGRIQEQKELERAYLSTDSEFVMVYGRRRVGKTYLVREFFQNRFVFSCTGVANGSREEELMNFRSDLVRQGMPNCPVLRDWMEAFTFLHTLVEQSRDKRKVIFLDELPWMYTQKSDFLKALEHFWNDWAAFQHNVVLVVCGSAASWMVKKITKSRGGLHDRITLPLKLQPFDLSEVKAFLVSQGIYWDDRTIAECYMILGGIPYYLKLLDKSLSMAQNIDRLFFASNALLKSEFENLYASLFRDSKDYVKIIEILSVKKSGFLREEIVSRGKFKDGGSVSEKLDDLQECGFISKFPAKGLVGSIYRLADFYSLFYFQFIRNGAFGDEHYWMHLQGQPAYYTWKGLSFERLCFAHSGRIKSALGVDGVLTKLYAYCDREVQVDMVLERNDRVVNIFEIKCTDEPYAVTEADERKFRLRRQAISRLYKKQMAFSTILLSSEGVVPNAHAAAVQRVLTLNDLF